MSKGLCTARLLYRQGHRVIGADYSKLSHGRFSIAVDKFYLLSKPVTEVAAQDVLDKNPYIGRLLEIIQAEKVDLWISVSDVNAAIQDARARDTIESCTSARVIQLREPDVNFLHNKATFAEHVQSLGLNVPETKTVCNKQSLIAFLCQRGGVSLRSGYNKRYIVKPIDVDDIARFNMVVLPQQTEEETLQCINSISFGDGIKPSHIVQEYIQGPEFCTHSLIVRGQLRAFVACSSSGVLMHYSALPNDSTLSQKMLSFTELMVKAGGLDWTGHVSFDFLMKSDGLQDKLPEDIEIYPIECNPRVHTAVVLFNNTTEIVSEYLITLEQNIAPRVHPLYPEKLQGYYWIGQDFVEHVAYPAMTLFLFRDSTIGQFIQSVLVFCNHVWNCREVTFEAWDPWPFWWLYHVYWPVQFAHYMIHGRWQMINVSTGKIFQAP